MIQQASINCSKHSEFQATTQYRDQVSSKHLSNPQLHTGTGMIIGPCPKKERLHDVIIFILGTGA